MQRPIGITILAVLAVIGGILSILGGLALVGFGVAAGAVAGTGLATVVDLLLLISGVLSLVLAYGFWTLKPWGWTLGVGLSGAGIVIYILQYVNDSTQLVSAIIGIAISLVVLWYLFQPHVKAAFGRT